MYPVLQPVLYALHVMLKPQAGTLYPCNALEHQHSSMGAPLTISETDAQRDDQLETEGGLTGKGDVEASLPRGVVGLELETGHVATAGDGGRKLVS